jgi:vacuolar-type H+-ATPase subunit C/Vma6
MYSSLLSPQDFARLSDSPELSTLISQLKQTAYAPYLESLKEKEFTPQKLDLAIKGRLAASYRVTQMAPEHARHFGSYIFESRTEGNPAGGAHRSQLGGAGCAFPMGE